MQPVIAQPIPFSKTKIEQYFELLYGEHMAAFPKKRVRRKGEAAHYQYDKQRPWIYVGAAEEMKPASTFSTLYNYLWDPKRKNTYYTPNSFYRSDGRLIENVRWIHAIQLDIDVKNEYIANQGMTLLDVFERINDAGLPVPTAIITTPSGGYQPIWMIKSSIRATPKARSLYTAIQKHMAADIGADVFAVGVERIFRTPTEQTIAFMETNNVYDFQVFVDWRDINHPLKWNTQTIQKVEEYDIMGHPAIRKLYNQDANVGKRDMTCFTLSLSMKFSGWQLDKAEQEIEKWWYECVEKGGSKPFRLMDALYRVRRVFRLDRYQRPSSHYIYQLTGIEFSYRSLRVFTLAKSREERIRTHKHEWKADLLEFMRQGNREIEGTLDEISTLLKMPKSSLKNVLKDLAEDGQISVHTTRGRNGSTRVVLIDTPSENEAQQIKKENRSNIVSLTCNEIGQARREAALSSIHKKNQPREKKSHSHITIGEEVGGVSRKCSNVVELSTFMDTT